jgi:tetratricopeptide (TPR) repeat protein
VKRLLAFAAMILALAASAAGQPAEELVHAGDTAAAADRHQDAIAAYETAIARHPALRAELTAKLGRQYLWAGKTSPAVELLREYVGTHPNDCDVRYDYALALSWNNHLRAARNEYAQLRTLCPARGQQARLREAQVARWQDRQTEAAALYRQVLAEGNDDERRDARAGLGFVELEKDYNRNASAVFATELARNATATVYEGSALSAVRMGDPAAAAAVIQRAEAAKELTRDLADVREELRRRDHFALTPRMNVFHDADGTDYRGAELGGSFGWMRSGRAEASFGTSTLERGSEGIDDHWLGLSIEHRFSPSFAVVASGRSHEFDPIDFRPNTGEVNLAVTPNDRTRVDVAAARILISDNISALEHRLEGNYASLGIDRRLTDLTTISLSADDTRWNTENDRQRFRFNVIHRFEGVPRVTVEWPSLYMRYDQGFAFNLFSPRRYLETGPAVNVYRRFARYWSTSVYVRAGVQQEEHSGWTGLGVARVSLDRDLHDLWALGLVVSWSNSNLASSTGFRRTAGSLHLTRRF